MKNTLRFASDDVRFKECNFTTYILSDISFKINTLCFYKIDNKTTMSSFYCLGSRRKLKNCKRRSSGSPRVPFSTSQLMTLEQKYTENHYLSGSQVTELASSLNLPHQRIKIWFQNRRAREKRSQEENSMGTSTEDHPPLQQQQVGFKHATTCCVPFSLRANLSMNLCGLGNYSPYQMLSTFVNVDGYSCGTLEF